MTESAPRILLLGGTAWLGGHVARAALDRGLHVTCVARGRSGAAPDGAHLVAADRDDPGALDDVAAQRWDLVVDVARQPGQVRRAAQALADAATSYVLVSSASVYADHSDVGDDETAPLRPALAGEVMESMATYGEAKVACERHVAEAFGGRALLARVGLIGGPGDVSGRTGYWPSRFARPSTPDGRVLVPEAPTEFAQVVDVRDLAEWLLAAGLAGASGAMNVLGDTLTLPEHLALARRVAGHDGPVVGVPTDWLRNHDVRPWAGPRSLPLWIGDPDWVGFASRSGAAARAAGFRPRPPAETLRDTLAWEQQHDGDRGAGLTADEERELLTAADADGVGRLIDL